MPQNFGDVWRRARLHCGAPTMLVRDWVDAAWKELARDRHWAFLRAESRLTINASRSLAAVTMTRGSTTVTSAGLFVAADAGRQFRSSSTSAVQVFTIAAFTDVNTITLDQAWGDASGAVAASIYDGYATMPADFGSFRLIADPYNQRRLAFWITEDQLNILDPTRQSSDSGPRCLVARVPSAYTATLGRLAYEYWPRPTADRSYPYLYNKQAASIDDTTTFSGVLADAADVLLDGTLAHAARWPGTADVRNPYFNPVLAKTLQDKFDLGKQKLSLRDDEQYVDDLATVHWERWPLADLAYNDHSLRATDATIVDLY